MITTEGTIGERAVMTSPPATMPSDRTAQDAEAVATGDSQADHRGNSGEAVARWSGLLLLFTMITSFIAAGLASSVGDYHVERDDVPDVLKRVADHQGAHVAEIGFDLVSWVATVVVAAVLWLTFVQRERVWALLGAVALAAGGVVLALHDIPNFVLTSVADRFVTASGAEAVALETTGALVLSTASWGLSVGITFFGIGVLSFGVATLRSRLVPTVLGWLGVAAGLLVAVGVWLPRIDVSLNPAFVALAIPVGLWQLGLGLWLVLRGTAGGRRAQGPPTRP